MFENITASLQTFGISAHEQLAEIFSRLQPLNFAKDDFLVKEGQVSHTFYFLNKGAFRHYTITDTGEEFTINLFVQNDWMLEYKSFMTQQPSQNFIQAVMESEVFALSAWQFHELVKISDCFFKLGGILQTKNQDFQHNRLSPEEKYELLLSTHPELLHYFPLKHIASYMGITPETLSRIRKKISS